MRPISPKVKKLLLADPYMQRCRLCFREGVQFHHCTGVLNRQYDAVWNIQPACPTCHKLVDTDKNVKRFFELMAIRRMTEQDRKTHWKWDWKDKENRLFDGLPEHLKKIANLSTYPA